jgi:hypothetical protein
MIATDVTHCERHHYIPRFLLKAWCGTDGKLTVYSRRNGQVITSLLNPRSTAFEANLYSFEQVARQKKHAIEAEFMTPEIDTPAAPIVQKILDREFYKITNKERWDFTRFVLSLRARHPDALKLVSEKGREELIAALARDPDEYLAVKEQSWPATLVEYVHQNVPALTPNFGVSLLPTLIADKKRVERVFSMPWWVHDVREANTDLVLSDRPCLLEGSTDTGGCLIVLPLSPTMLFFACNEEQKIRQLRSTNVTKLVKAVNKISVTYAVERVYATGQHHLPLVQKYLNSERVSPLEAASS